MASLSPETKPDVFLSFRRKDTRSNFSGHLLAALTRNCIDAAFTADDDCVHGRGRGISDTLLESRVSVVVFSPNYAESPLCLDELVMIVECKDMVVLPVFLGVEPTHVRKQSGPFGDGFNRLLQDQDPLLLKDREEAWRNALVEIANLSGWDSKEKSEDKIVAEIVTRVEKILDQVSLEDQYDGFVGFSRVEKVESLIRLASPGEVSLIGIWGMGGIGKTTIARLLFYRLANRFDGACFIGNVRAKAEREGLDFVRKDMILQLLGLQSDIAGPYMLSPAIRRKLGRQKLLIVLDDVNNPRQLKALVGRQDFCGHGSRIVVTSRDKQVLKNACAILYQVEKLNRREALLLFKLHAFREDQPTEELYQLSKKAITFAQGLPLALEVLSCNLYGRNLEEWEMELSKLEEIPDIEVTDILRNSYDGLDQKEKNIFLDIACIFQGWIKDRVESILDGCGFHAVIGLSRLLDKALITVSKGKVWMHDLLQQMGQDIVLHECIEEPGKRSRLWRWKDIDDVLTSDMGTENVEAISLDLSKTTDMFLKPSAFMRIAKLRVLSFHYARSQAEVSRKTRLDNARKGSYFRKDMKIHLPEGLEFLPNELRYFSWFQYPLESLPMKFQPVYLVELDMFKSHIKELWCGALQPHLPHLKSMDLTSCVDLIKLPDFSKIPNLESLYLAECESLEEVPSSIQHLSNLQNFSISGCMNLNKLLELPPNIVDLNLCGTAIQELPSSSIGKLSSLHMLQLFKCSKLTSIPENIGNLSSLKRLDVSCTAIRKLPDNFCNLESLEFLRLDRCWNLNKLPKDLGNLKTLQHLDTSESPIKSLPSSMVHLLELKTLLCSEYRGTQLLNFGSQNPFLMSLKELDLQNSNLRSLPANIELLPSLQILLLSNCKCLTLLPKLPSSLQWLEAANCTSLESVHSLPVADQARGRGFITDFYNCVKLDGNSRIKILSVAWQRFEVLGKSQTPSVQHHGNKDSQHGGSDDEEDRDEFDKGDSDEEDPSEGRAFMTIPRSRVPEWFEHSAAGSSLTIDRVGGRLLELGRLAFCLVVAPTFVEERCIWAQCTCTLVSESGESQARVCGNNSVWRPQYHKNPTSENLILWYEPDQVLEAPPMFSSKVKATFEFYAAGFQITECGVTPVGNNCTRSLVSQSAQDRNHGNQDEPSSKRLKKIP